MKKLVLTILAAVLMTGTFTSCIDNEIPDEVKNIYQGQANLLAARATLATAQANFQNAQADVQAAQAASIEAQTAATNIANAYATANNAVQLQVAQAQLEAMLANAITQAELSRIALERAQLEWEQQMNSIKLAIAAANNAQLQQYFGTYMMYNNTVSNLKVDEVNKNLQITNHIIATTLNQTSDAVALANLNNTVTMLQADKVVLEATKADFEALIAAGTTTGDEEARRVQLVAEIEANDDAIHALDIAITEKNNEIAAATTALNDLVGSNIAALQVMYATKTADLAVAIGTKEGAEAANVALQTSIDNYTTRITNYAADKAALETAKANAITAKATADAAETAATTAQGTAANADATEQQNLLDVITAVNNIDADLNAAAADLAAKLAIQAGAPAMVSAATTAQGNAQTEYDAAKLLFDADPNGTTWTNGGPDGQLGDHSDVPGTSFAEILTVTGIGANQVATFGPSTAAVPAGGVVTVNSQGTFTLADVGLYFDVEADDVMPANSNLVRFQLATTALDTANANLTAANAAAATAAADVAAAQVVYDDLAADFAVATTAVATQQAIADGTAATLAAANATLATATTNAANAATAVTTATNALNTFNATTLVDLQNWKQDDEVQMSVNNATIAAQAVIITDLEAEIATLVAQIDAGKTPAVIAQEAAIATLTMDRDVLVMNKTMLTTENGFKQSIVAAIEMDLESPGVTYYDFYVQQIDATQALIDAKVMAIATAQAAVNNFTSSADADASTLARLQLELTQIQDNIAVNVALAAKYKTLFESLI